MRIRVSQIPILIEKAFEPTERRLMDLDFSGVLTGNIATLTIDDPQGWIAASAHAAQLVTLTIAAGLPDEAAVVIITATTLDGHPNKQTLRLTCIDPAATLEEVYP